MVLGLKFNHKFSNYNLLVFACYLPPEYSTWGRDSHEYFSHLLSQIYLADDIDYLYICGDTNAKIGDLNDSIELDSILARTILDNTNKAYRPNAHLLYIVMHYNGSIIMLHYNYNHLNKF